LMSSRMRAKRAMAANRQQCFKTARIFGIEGMGFSPSVKEWKRPRL
jgi:hypothetical protein